MNPSILVLTSTIIASVLALVMSAITIIFYIRRARLPDATRYENLRELRVEEEMLLAERRQELSVVEQKIQQRDRLIAEVSAMEERIATLRMEMDSLDTARLEIEEVKEAAAQAASELATVNQELSEKRAELQGIIADLDPGRLASLREENEKLERERRELEENLPKLRIERDNALRAIQEAGTSTARIAALEIELGTVEKELENLEPKRAELRDVETKVANRKDEAAKLSDELGQLNARKAVLEKELSSPVEGLRTEEILADLTKIPSCIEAPAQRRKIPRNEGEALQTVTQYLDKLDLKYSRRTVNAFHTALKINDNAQLTVLAGVSGTGKSLLPRRYAEAMGIHFLQIAVEPRWDSPQDLLGFYNYIEKKYRATDLSRLLVYMDPYESVARPKNAPDRTDNLALVLLDEMNLARVEYYFSEFLSRLEVRPPYQQADDQLKRSDAMIPVDIRGLKNSLSLYPSHNLLFSGTMNDDESTQALSDKVLDRGNVMQFAAPHEFTNPDNPKNISRPDEAQSFKSWRNWVRQGNTLSGANRDTANSVIKKLAEIMDESGRPFGYRLRDSILAYAASYPKDGHSDQDVRIPLADQVEFRILPKLRGIEIENYQGAFDKLENILRNDLADSTFADRISALRESQARGTGLFVWRGLAR